MPFQPGQSGNPSGRPKDHIGRFIRARSEKDGQKLADKLWALALKGNLKAAEMVLERSDGKVPLPTTVEGGLVIEVKRADRKP